MKTLYIPIFRGVIKLNEILDKEIPCKIIKYSKKYDNSTIINKGIEWLGQHQPAKYREENYRKGLKFLKSYSPDDKLDTIFWVEEVKVGDKLEWVQKTHNTTHTYCEKRVKLLVKYISNELISLVVLPTKAEEPTKSSFSGTINNQEHHEYHR